MTKSIITKVIAGVLSIVVSATGIVAYNTHSTVPEQKTETVQVINATDVAASDISYDWEEVAEAEGFDKAKIQSEADEKNYVASLQNKGKAGPENKETDTATDKKTGTESKTGKTAESVAPVVSAKADTATAKTNIVTQNTQTQAVQSQNTQTGQSQNTQSQNTQTQNVQSQNAQTGNQNVTDQNQNTEDKAAKEAEERARKEAEEKAKKEAAEKKAAEERAKKEAEEKAAAEKAEKERLAAEQAEKERLAAEQAEKERLAAEQAEAERLAAEQAAREQEALASCDVDASITIPEKKPVIKKITHYACVCGYDTTDYDAFKQHALEGARKGEIHNYTFWDEEVEVYE